MVEDLVDLEGHGLTWPHVGNLAEPAICVKGFRFIVVDKLELSTFDCGMCDFGHLDYLQWKNCSSW